MPPCFSLGKQSNFHLLLRIFFTARNFPPCKILLSMIHYTSIEAFALLPLEFISVRPVGSYALFSIKISIPSSCGRTGQDLLHFPACEAFKAVSRPWLCQYLYPDFVPQALLCPDSRLSSITDTRGRNYAVSGEFRKNYLPQRLKFQTGF